MPSLPALLQTRGARVAEAGLTVTVAARRVRPFVKSAVAAMVLATTAMATTAVTTLATGALRPAGASPVRQSPEHSPGCTLPPRLSRGRIIVAVVTDFGGAHGKVMVSCVVATPGESGAQVLAAQAELLGYPAPRYAQSGSGLLCAIDGYPANGCGTRSGSHYAYWAYWHGGRRWQYASDGPSDWKVAGGDVEGWRFEPDGSATPSDPPPRAPSSAASLEHRAATVQSVASSERSSSQAAGPASQSHDGGAGSSPLPFVLGMVLIVLIGAAGMLRARRNRQRAT
jgi:hypothetical protein